MKDTADFENWCSYFPNHINPKDANFVGNVEYLQRLINYYSENFVLPNPYQDYTESFLEKTVLTYLDNVATLPQIDSFSLQLLLTTLNYINHMVINSIYSKDKNTKLFLEYPEYILNFEAKFFENNKNSPQNFFKLVFDEIDNFIKNIIETELTWQTAPLGFSYIISFFDFALFAGAGEHACQFYVTNLSKFLKNYFFFLEKRISTINNNFAVFEDELDELAYIKNINQSVFDLESDKYIDENLKMNVINIHINYLIFWIKHSKSSITQSNLCKMLSKFAKIPEFILKIEEIIRREEFDLIILHEDTNLQLISDLSSFISFRFSYEKLKEFWLKSLTLPKDNQTILSKIVGKSYDWLQPKEQTVFAGEVLSSTNLCSSHIELLQHIILNLYLTDPIFSSNIISKLLKETDTSLSLLVDNIDVSCNFSKFIFDSLCQNASLPKSIEILKLIIEKSQNSRIFLEQNELFKLLSESESDCSLIFYAHSFKYSYFSLGIKEVTKIWPHMEKSDKVFSAFLSAFCYKGPFFYDNNALNYFLSTLNDHVLKGESNTMIIDFIYYIIICDALKKKDIDARVIGSNHNIQIPILFKIGKFCFDGFDLLLKYLLHNKNQMIFEYAKSKLFFLWNNSTNHVDTLQQLVDMFIKILDNSEQAIIRCYEFLMEVMNSDRQMYASDLGISIHRAPSKKGDINIILESETYNKTFSIYCNPTNVVDKIGHRAFYLFKAVDDTIELYKNGTLLYPYMTLEMQGISNNSRISILYVENPNFPNNYFQNLPEVIFGNTEIVQKSLILLHDTEISGTKKADAILNFLNNLPTSIEVSSLLDNFEKYIAELSNALSVEERQYYLQAFFNSLFDDHYRKVFTENASYTNIMTFYIEKELDKRGKNLIFLILKEIIPDKIKLDNDCFIEKLIVDLSESKSRKQDKLIIDLLKYLLMKINNLISILTQNIILLVKNMRIPILGSLLTFLPAEPKNEVFLVLLSNFVEFSENEEQLPIYFDALISVSPENEENPEINEFLLAHFKEFKNDMFSNICHYLSSQSQLFRQIDFDYLFSRLPNIDGFRAVLDLITNICHNDAEKHAKATEFFIDYVNSELSLYNHDSSYVDLTKNRNRRPGIQNLGATCYANCSLQMLFNVPQFADSIITAKNFNKISQKELQRLFMTLRFGSIDVADPTNLLNNITLIGEKINFAEQQDTAEFLLSVLNDLPEECTQYFCGTLTNTFEGTSLPFHSANSEVFFTLSVNVVGYNSLEDSLANYGKPEIVKNYNDPSRKAMIDVKHSTKIKILPQILLVHLRRFIYNNKIGKRRKVNDPFIFPMTLDMSKYADSSDDLNLGKSMQYKLIGFILHIGTAEFGHFHYVGLVNGVWTEFNDSVVGNYDISDISKDAYGTSNQKSPSAYLLVYSCVDLASSLTESDLSENLAKELNQNRIKNNQKMISKSEEFFSFAVTVDNVRFMYNYYMNILLHMNSGEKCELIRSNLFDSVNKESMIETIGKYIFYNQKPILLCFFYCHNQEVIGSLTSFLKNLVIYLNVNSSFNLVNILLYHLTQFLYLWDNGKFIVSLALEFLTNNPNRVMLAYSHAWHNTLITFLYEWFNNQLNISKISNVDFSVLFRLLKLFASTFDENICMYIANFEKFVRRSPHHIAAFQELMSEIWAHKNNAYNQGPPQ